MSKRDNSIYNMFLSMYFISGNEVGVEETEGGIETRTKTGEDGKSWALLTVKTKRRI